MYNLLRLWCPYLKRWETEAWRLTPGQRVRMRGDRIRAQVPVFKKPALPDFREPQTFRVLPTSVSPAASATAKTKPSHPCSQTRAHISTTQLVIVSLYFPQLLTLSGQEGEECAWGSLRGFVFRPGPLPVLPVPSRTRGLSWIWVLAGSLLLNFGEADILVGWKKMKSSQCPYVPCF